MKNFFIFLLLTLTATFFASEFFATGNPKWGTFAVFVFVFSLPSAIATGIELSRRG